MLPVEKIAEICHEANRVYCKAIGDNTQVMWDTAPGWQQSSAINGVKYHLSGDHHPADQHQNWMEEKTLGGWKYGPVKDVNKKEHPCYLPYEDLPEEQKVKDFIFMNIVKAFKDAEPHV
jgi:hypothetical protein